MKDKILHFVQDDNEAENGMLYFVIHRRNDEEYGDGRIVIRPYDVWDDGVYRFCHSE